MSVHELFSDEETATNTESDIDLLAEDTRSDDDKLREDLQNCLGRADDLWGSADPWSVLNDSNGLTWTSRSIVLDLVIRGLEAVQEANQSASGSETQQDQDRASVEDEFTQIEQRLKTLLGRIATDDGWSWIKSNAMPLRNYFVVRLDSIQEVHEGQMEAIAEIRRLLAPLSNRDSRRSERGASTGSVSDGSLDD